MEFLSAIDSAPLEVLTSYTISYSEAPKRFQNVGDFCKKLLLVLNGKSMDEPNPMLGEVSDGSKKSKKNADFWYHFCASEYNIL